MQKKNDNIIEYKAEIYPFSLWVTKSIDGLDKKFVFVDMRDSSEENIDGYKQLIDVQKSVDAITIPVWERSTGRRGVLVVLLSNIDTNLIAHESVHVADYIFQETCMYTSDFRDGNEPYAYLVGWSAGCISDSLIKLKKNDSRRKQINMGVRKEKH